MEVHCVDDCQHVMTARIGASLGHAIINRDAVIGLLKKLKTSMEWIERYKGLQLRVAVYESMGEAHSIELQHYAKRYWWKHPDIRTFVSVLDSPSGPIVKGTICCRIHDSELESSVRGLFKAYEPNLQASELYLQKV